MNSETTPHAAELSLHQTLRHVEEYVRREPTKAAAAALGTGLVLNLLPPRLLASVAGNLVTRLLPPVLLGLGVLKAFEICCDKETARKR